MVGVGVTPELIGTVIMTIINWTSARNDYFAFELHDLRTTWHPVGGLYMFCKYMDSRWVPVYIGKASSFKDRLCNHEQWEPSVRLDATHILAMVVPQELERARLEAVLIKELNPPLNVQLKPSGLLSALMAQPAAANSAALGLLSLARQGLR